MSSLFYIWENIDLVGHFADRSVLFSFALFASIFLAFCINRVFLLYKNEKVYCVCHNDNTPEEKSPVILFYNPKSGGYYRSRFLSDMLSSRPMCVCVDISNPNCISTLRSIVPTPQSQIIICGGDIS